jgi:hypothetical protein
MTKKDKTPVSPGKGSIEASNPEDIDRFLSQVKSRPSSTGNGARGRLVFAMDATMSRQPTWDAACNLQGQMFAETSAIGGLDVQLIFFRGFGECKASRWASDPRTLSKIMSKVDCRGGHTQIGRVLSHISKGHKKQKINAAVFVGDAMEEDIDHLCALAGELGLNNVPLFMFQEGHDLIAEPAFREIARLSGGAYCRFDASSAKQLRDLLSAVAVYAAGGRAALENFSSSRSSQVRALLGQMK